MTQQYLAGELSLLPARLQGTAADPASQGAFAALRREAETAPPAALGSVAARAVRLGDTASWEALARSDTGRSAARPPPPRNRTSSG